MVSDSLLPTGMIWPFTGSEHSISVPDPSAVPKTGWEFVDFYAQPCGHCQALMPDWNDASHAWASEAPSNSHVAWVKMQCNGEGWAPGKDAAVCQAHHVEQFPTLRLYHVDNGKVDGVYQYEGDRSAESLTNFVREHVEGATEQGFGLDSFANFLPGLAAWAMKTTKGWNMERSFL